MNQHEDLLIDALLDYGFTVEEALRLIALQQRVERERRDQARGQLGPLASEYDDPSALN